MLTLLLTLFTAQADDLKAQYKWENKPTIEICPEAKVTTQEIKSALQYWEKEIGFQYKKLTRVSYCAPNKWQTIQITNGDAITKENVLAETIFEWYFYPDSDPHQTNKYIDHAIVQIPDNIPYERQDIITHEIGHSIGLMHSNHEIMKSHF